MMDEPEAAVCQSRYQSRFEDLQTTADQGDSVPRPLGDGAPSPRGPDSEKDVEMASEDATAAGTADHDSLPPASAGAPTQDAAASAAQRPAMSLQQLQQLVAIQAQLVQLQQAAASADQSPHQVIAAPPPQTVAPPATVAPPQTVSAVPQLILAGGQLAHGIQGAQLLIPSSHGLTMQPIITIPASQVSGGRLAQLCLSSGQVFAATPANLQALVAPPVAPLVASAATNVSQATPPALATLHPPAALSTPLTFAAALGGAVGSGAPQHQQYSAAGGRAPAAYAAPPGRYSAPPGGYSAPPGGYPAPQYVVRPRAAPPQPPRTDDDAASSVDSADSLDPFKDASNQPTISQATCSVVDGIDLEEVKQFARAFKLRRLSLGLTQTQVGQALSVSMGPAYSQSAICRFEKLDITPKSAQKIKPILEKWMLEAEERLKVGAQNLVDFCGQEPSKKRKKRTSFTPQALEVLNTHFERNTHPSGPEITQLAARLGHQREVVRIWFCNKRQALKNTVRLMTKPAAPPRTQQSGGGGGGGVVVSASPAAAPRPADGRLMALSTLSSLHGGYLPTAGPQPAMRAV